MAGHRLAVHEEEQVGHLMVLEHVHLLAEVLEVNLIPLVVPLLLRGVVLVDRLEGGVANAMELLQYLALELNLEHIHEMGLVDQMGLVVRLYEELVVHFQHG